MRKCHSSPDCLAHSWESRFQHGKSANTVSYVGFSDRGHGLFSRVPPSESCVWVCVFAQDKCKHINTFLGINFPAACNINQAPWHTCTHARTPDSAGFRDPQRDRGMSSVSQLPRQQPWKRDPGKIALDSKHPVCHPCGCVHLNCSCLWLCGREVAWLRTRTFFCLCVSVNKCFYTICCPVCKPAQNKSLLPLVLCNCCSLVICTWNGFAVRVVEFLKVRQAT